MSNQVFIIRNQQGHFWGKARQWVDGREARGIYRSKHRDEVLNTLIELGAKDIELRGEVLEAEINQRGEPCVEISAVPLPQIELAINQVEPSTDAEVEPETAETST